MKAREAREANPDILNEQVSDTLFQIRSELSGVGFFSPETLTSEITDSIVEKLENLAKMAGEVGDRAKKEVLKSLSLRFYGLRTVGIVDNLEKFQSAAAHASDLLNNTLLCWDGMVKKIKVK